MFWSLSCCVKHGLNSVSASGSSSPGTQWRTVEGAGDLWVKSLA